MSIVRVSYAVPRLAGMPKQRLTISLDQDLVAAAAAAVADGRADSVSAWVSEALEARVAHQRRLDAMAVAVAGYEAEHGAFTDEELADQVRRDRDDAAALRNDRPTDRRGAA